MCSKIFLFFGENHKFQSNQSASGREPTALRTLPGKNSPFPVIFLKQQGASCKVETFLKSSCRFYFKKCKNNILCEI